MRRVDRGVQQADGDGLGAHLPDRFDGLVQRRRGQGAFHAAIGAHPLGNAQAALPRDQRLGALLPQAVDVAPGVAADLQHVAEPVGRQQHAAGQLAFQDGVGGDGGAVQQQAHVRQGEAEPARRLVDAGHPAGLGEIAEAFRHQASGAHFGKVCLEF